MIRYLILLLLFVSCRESVMDRAGKANDRVQNQIAVQNAVENDVLSDSTITDHIDPDEYSKEQLTEMATETGEASTDIIPEIEFWDRVTKDGTFAAFQTALKQAKTLEERWRVVDNFPEIAERAGMTDALAPRDSLKMKK